jgi:hypothetical protein
MVVDRSSVDLDRGSKSMRSAAAPARPDHDTSDCGRAAARAVRALPAFLLAAVASGAAMTGLAQSGVPCTAITDDAERLACYDKALRPAPAPATTSTPAPRAAVPAPAPAPVRADERRQARQVRESSAPEPTPAPAPRAAPRATADEGIVPIVIVGIRAVPGREATFTAEDGTAWVQIDSQRLVGLPDAPFAAEIRPGAMGSYFLVPAERGRAVRVRPVR